MEGVHVAVGGVQLESKATGRMHYCFRDWLSEVILFYCKGNCSQVECGVEHKRNAEHCIVLAGDLKCLVYYVITKLNITHLAGDPKRKGWGSTCRHGLIYRVTEIRK